ncbi:MAG: ATP-binding protein [Candidatus Brocadiia bacterium]
MGPIALLDLVALLALLAALAGAARAPGRAIGAGARAVLCASLAAFAFGAFSNVLQHTGVTARLDPYEDYAEVLLFPLLLHFVFAQRSAEELTRRRRAEAALRGAKASLSALIDASPLAIVAIDIEGKVWTWNPAAERTFGWSAEEAVGGPVPTASGQWRGQHDALREHLARGESITDLELRRQRKDGSAIDVRVSAAPLRDEAGHVVGAMAVMADVTAQRRAEEALRRRDAILEAVAFCSRRFLAAEDPDAAIPDALRRLGETTDACRVFVFENATDPQGILRTSLRYEWAAEGFPRILDDEALHGVSYESPAFARLKDTLPPGGAVFLNTGQMTDAERQLHESYGVRSVGVVPILLGGAWWGFIGFHDCRAERVWSPAEKGALRVAADIFGAALRRERDVAERRRLEDQLRHAQRMESVGRLAGGIAHDFNNLLTAINGYAGMALRTLDDDDPLREDIHQIEQAGRRAAELTRQLLAFSRKQMLEMRTLDLNEVVRQLEPMLRSLLGEEAALDVRLASDLWPVRADPTQIQHVLMNLAVNARDAMPRSGRLTIETANVQAGQEDELPASLRPGPCVCLTVADTGEGMEPQTLERVFEPFFTTKEVGRGTGLGLSTVYGIVKQHGGDVAVASRRGQGTTFRIFFPCVEQAGESDPRPATGHPAAGDQETVLLVEDEEAMRRLARDALASRGYRVLEAPSPQRAIEIARQHDDAIHLLLTDVVMPGGRGPELYRRLCQLRPETKALYISGHSAPLAGVEETAAPLLGKPFTPQQLAAKVREVLDA